jgi:cyclopropane fatty-acyl-phospholipid synthase-like methyltransferase
MPHRRRPNNGLDVASHVLHLVAMGFFDTEDGVRQYEEMAEGYDGRELVDRLRRHLPAGSSVLEIGMGPGKDLDMLLETYEATGSDNSQLFLDRYRARKSAPVPELVLLDAVELETPRRFDALYSNKVLQHLSRDQLRRSLSRQGELLVPGGVALHSLWNGDKEDEEHAGLLFVYYTVESFTELLPSSL